MLLGQNLGRRHQRALPARINRQHGRQGRHNGFSRAHIALQQTVHGHVARQILRNLFAHAALGARQCKGQCGQKLLVQIEAPIRRARRRQLGRAQCIAGTLGRQFRQLLRQQFFGF